jgi:D-threo-aldose 1-dehydrogenase
MDPAAGVRLGRTPLTVTPLGLGTVPLGGLYREVVEADALAVLRHAHELGLRLFDTAPVYGFGLAERRLGEVLPTLPRQEIVVATKVGRLLRADAPPDPALQFRGERMFRGGLDLNPLFDFSYEGAMRSLEESLTRLRLDGVEIVHLHDPDDHYEQALAGAYVALHELRAAGTIAAIGAGMTQSAMLARFAREADFDCFLLAGRYSLLDQSAIDDLLPVCAERGIAVIVGGVFNSGILADPDQGATYDYQPANLPLIERAHRLRDVCARHGVPLRAAAVQFPTGHPAVTTVLIGVRSVAELEDNLRMFRYEIAPDCWQELKAEGLLRPDVPVPSHVPA